MSKANADMGVLFDLDGVLIDTGQFHKQSWFDLAEKEGFAISDEFFRQTFGMQNYQILPLLAGSKLSGKEIDRMADWKERRYRQLINGKLTLLQGVKELIEDLKENGFLLAIGTSTPHANLTFMLEQLPVDGYFDAYVAGEDVKNGKPAPDTFLKAAQKLSLLPEYCVVVEDAVQGVQAGKAGGMKVLAVTTTRSKEELNQADMVVENLTQVTAADFINLLNITK